jgi:hypothetical protein
MLSEGVGAFGSLVSVGGEVVYDFAAMERSIFVYGGITGSLETILSLGGSIYAGEGVGFRSNETILKDYSGHFGVFSVGVGGGTAIYNRTGIGAGVGLTGFWTPMLLTGGGQIIGVAGYLSGNIGGDLNVVPLLDVAVGGLWYVPVGTQTYYAGDRNEGTITRSRTNKTKLVFDILRGADSPWSSLPPNPLYSAAKLPFRTIAMADALHWAEIHDEIYINSWNVP